MTGTDGDRRTGHATAAGPRVSALLDSGRLDLPLPGSGRTLDRFAALRDLGAEDLVVARLAEAHVDARAVLAELLTGPDEVLPPGTHRRLWGVWAADPPAAPLRAVHRPGAHVAWSLSGSKPWCSGAGTCGRALVTAHAEDGYRLFAVDPTHPGVSVRPSRWAVGAGMSGSDTCDLELTDVPARPVGEVDAYLHRPGFWWGAAGVAAVWLGGALRVALALERAAGRHGSDLVLASLGRVDAAQHAAWCTLVEVARLADRSVAGDAPATQEQAHLAAARSRAAVETAVEVTLHETGRATGPGPLAMDPDHARAVADLQVYVRQSHGDRDLAVLGGLALAATDPGAPS
ncbi:acyl-CoA dehydrogenase family protein [Jannaschia sp. R86511]|uniref:acyl-CoA dehydrogenase family protein n=1 Tax=Jannaschia sp. R86511 TaxID=3093853 RepID=UPI0036D27ED1